MVKSGLIYGAVAAIFVLGFSLLSPYCAPCLGLFFGLAAGYTAGALEKPNNSRDCLRAGGIAGLITGGIAFVGGLIGGVINGTMVNAASIEQIYQMLGLPTTIINQSQLFLYQMVGAVCIGIFNIVWMALLGLAGGAIWYQVKGKNQSTTVIIQQPPVPPAY